MSMTETRHWGEIDGVSIDFPMTVNAMNSATLTFTVPIGPARAVVPGTGFEVADMGDGNAMVVLALVDYIENPWGDYNEVNFGMLVHPAGRPEEVGAFQWRMPVNQEMTCHAGNEVLGLPKSVDEVNFDYTDESVSVELIMDGAMTFRGAPAGGADGRAHGVGHTHILLSRRTTHVGAADHRALDGPGRSGRCAPGTGDRPGRGGAGEPRPSQDPRHCDVGRGPVRHLRVADAAVTEVGRPRHSLEKKETDAMRGSLRAAAGFSTGN